MNTSRPGDLMDTAAILAMIGQAPGRGTEAMLDALRGSAGLHEVVLDGGWGSLWDAVAAPARTPSTHHPAPTVPDGDGTGTDSHVRFVKALAAQRDASGLSLRDLAPRVGRSPATLSRIFAGKSLPTRTLLTKILTAMRAPAAIGQRIMYLWTQAPRPVQGTARPATGTGTGTGDGVPEADIVVHGGAVSFSGADVTAGKSIVVHDGRVSLSTAAARAAKQIVVHGGALAIGDSPAHEVPDTEEPGRPVLRRVQ